MNKITISPIGDILQFQRGYDLPSEYRTEGEYPVISSAGFSGTHNEYKVGGENVVTGRYGTIGKIYYYDGKCWPLNTSLYVKDFKGNLPKYIYYLLQYALNVDGKDKSTVPGVNRNVLHMLEVPYYKDHLYQEMIIRPLEAIDKKIALNKRIAAELEAMIKTIYDYWFVQFDFPDIDGKSYRSSGGEMVLDKQLKRKIPKGWECIPLNKRFAFERGVEVGAKNYSNINKNGFVPYYRVSDVGSQSDTYVDPKLLNNKLLKFEDVCVTFDGTVGKVDFGLVGGYSTGLRKIFDLEGAINNAVIYSIFKSDYAQIVINKYATGSNILHASESINHLYIAFNKRIYDKFQDVISPLFDKMLAMKKENLKLAAIRDWLLPILMNGQAVVQ
ncbi:MAG: restriction endonuclease subunit S [Bacteroidia bacterium]|jgi:type I restriction enzyme S subunit|nr:restriction endonuclease subunit S [Bacteroidia bacterium]